MRSALARFLGHVSPEPNTGCWLWDGYCNAKGYGVFSPDRRSLLAHRWSYETFVGTVPPGLYVLHKCKGTRSCVNPSHLYAGDQVQNMRDREADGNAPRGERGARAKVSDAEAEQMRLMSSLGDVPASALADVFGMSRKGVSKILSGERFWHLGAPTVLAQHPAPSPKENPT